MPGEGLNVGRVWAGLGLRLDHDDSDKFKRLLTSARADAAKPVSAKVRADVDRPSFTLAEQHLRSLRHEGDRSSASIGQLGGALRGLFTQAGGVAALGIAAQGMSSLTAGATALGSALAPLSGALAVVPSLAGAGAQGLGVFKLATDGVGKAVGGLNTQLDTTSKAFKALSPEAQQFARHLDALKPSVREIQQGAQRGLFPGLDKGLREASRNLPVIRGVVGETAKALGALAGRAGELVGSKGFGRDLATQGARNTRWLTEGGDAALHLADALRHVTLAAGPLTGWLVKDADHFAKLVDQQAKAGRESGRLAHFFDETRIAMSRVGRIGADLATAFLNIGKAGKPLGDTILVSLVRSADAFRKWTDSARGQNVIAKFFADAKPGIFEAGRLVHDLVVDFVKLGRGDQVAPLLRKLRVDVLPAINDLVDGTTKSFGPAFIDAVTQGIRLFTRIAGSSGPLVQFTKLLGAVLTGINRIIDRVPAIGTVLSAAVAVGGLYKALSLASTISGLGRVIGLLKTTRTLAAEQALVPGTPAGAGTSAVRGAVPVAGGSALSRLLGRAGPRVGAAAGLVAGASAAIVATGGFKAISESIKGASSSDLGLLDKYAKAIERVAKHGDSAGMRKLAAQLRDTAAANRDITKGDHLKAFADALDLTAKSGGKDLGALKAAFAAMGRSAGGDLKGVGEAVKGLGSTTRRVLDLKGVEHDLDSTFGLMARNTAGHMKDIHTAVTTNTAVIKQRLGTDTAEGRAAVAHNFNEAAKAVKRSMDAGVISTRTGTSEIRDLLIRGLQALGLSRTQARAKLETGTLQAESARTPGQGLAPTRARGGFLKRAVGGWIGARGQVSGDVVPLGDGALAAYGEFDAHGPGGRRAILNRHQAPLAEAMLAAGGFPGLDRLPSGRQLPILEQAMAPVGGLDSLFAAITRPHYLASGGRYQAGGRQFSKGQLAALWIRAGGDRGVASLMAAIALAESRGDPNVVNSIGATGLWQIHPGGSQYLNPLANARTAVAKYKTQGLGAWEAYTNGSYRQFLGAAAGATGLGGLGAIPKIIAARIAGSGATQGLAQRAATLSAATGNSVMARIASTLTPAAGGPAGAPGGLTASGPAGVGTFEGIPMANWVIGALRYARSKGFTGHPTSGYRPGRDPHTASGFSEHQGTQYPHGAVDFGSFTTGKAVKDAFVAAVADYTYPLIAPIGFRDDGHASGTGHARGGFLGRFAKGGFKPPRVMARHAQRSSGGGGGGTKLTIKALHSLQHDRVAEYDDLLGQVEDNRKRYEQADRRYNLTDEVFIRDDGTLDEDAVKRRAFELLGLGGIRRQILDELQRLAGIAARVIASYRTIINRLQRSLSHAKRKDRSGIRSKITDMRSRLDEWQGKLHDLQTSDIPDADLDWRELGKEYREVIGTRADAVTDAGADLPADDGTSGIGDGTGDTSTTEAAPTPPTALDIAAGVRAELQTYLAANRDVATQFAGNALTRQQAYGAGGLLSGAPSDTAALYGVRGFGASGDLAGSLGAGRGGPIIIVQDGGAAVRAHYPAAPDDAPTFVSQVRWQVENGLRR